jgi:hypothetical protein
MKTKHALLCLLATLILLSPPKSAQGQASGGPAAQGGPKLAEAVSPHSPESAAPVLEYLPGGMRLDEMGQSGWDHRVLTQVPAITSGETELIPAPRRPELTFHTVILADVDTGTHQGRGRVLRRVGVGLAQALGGRDTTVTMGTRNALRVAQTKESKFVLYSSEEQLRRARILAGTPTFAIVELQGKFAGANRHDKILLHFAILLEPESDRVRTIFWSTPGDDATGQEAPFESVSLLERELRYECPMDLRVERAFGLVPKGISLAMSQLPPGRRAPIAADLAGSLRGPAHDPNRLEARLRSLVGQFPETGGEIPDAPSTSRIDEDGTDRNRPAGSAPSSPRLGAAPLSWMVGLGVIGLLGSGILLRSRLRRDQPGSVTPTSCTPSGQTLELSSEPSEWRND